jgi:hypothetical protein
MGAFSNRPNISLNLAVTGVTPEAVNNRSYVTFYLYVNEDVSQPSFNNDPVGIGSISFTWNGGSTTFDPSGWSFNFSASGLQSQTIYSGAFYANHAANGDGGTLSGSASASISPLGSATASSSNALGDLIPDPVFTDSTVVATGSVGTAYSDAVAASNATSYSVFSGALPTSLTLNTSTGAITGTPTVPGVFTFVLRATNASGSVDTGTLTITVLGGGRVWNGTAFVAGTTRVWNGTAFVSSTTRIWNGSAWVSST